MCDIAKPQPSPDNHLAVSPSATAEKIKYRCEPTLSKENGLLFCGIDLHSNNSVVVISDENDKVLYSKRHPNGLEEIRSALSPYQSDLFGVVVESAFNWYWLVDGLQEAGYSVHLANTTAPARSWCAPKSMASCTKVMQALQPCLKSAPVADSEAPVRQCHRYLNHRADQLDYQNALARELPIGSGEIESAHRYIVQRRLKLPGAWWRAANADHMPSLRLNRANQQWNEYWDADFRQAA